MRIPDGRQHGCILLTKDDAWALRELMKPFEFSNEEDEDERLNFCDGLYEALLKLHVLELEEINLQVDYWDCMRINQAVKSGAWKGADQLLLQTWQVLHEYESGSPLRGQEIIQTEITVEAVCVTE